MSNRIAGTIAAIVIIILGIGAYTLFFRSGTPDGIGTLPPPSPTSTPPMGSTSTMWLVLRNEMSGFEVRYPTPVDDVDVGGGEFHLADRDGKDWWFSARVLPNTYAWTASSTCPSTPVTDGRSASATPMLVDGNEFCVSHEREGAAGSTYEDYTYVTRATKGFVALRFVVRHATDIRIYEGCETDADLQKELCQRLQWNESRDTELFTNILKTYRMIPAAS